MARIVSKPKATKSPQKKKGRTKVQVEGQLTCTLCGNETRGQVGLYFMSSTGERIRKPHCRDKDSCYRRAESTPSQKIKRHWNLFEGQQEED